MVGMHTVKCKKTCITGNEVVGKDDIRSCTVLCGDANGGKYSIGFTLLHVIVMK